MIALIRVIRGPLVLLSLSAFGTLVIRVNSWLVALQDQHAIAVAVKTVTFANCLLVSAK